MVKAFFLLVKPPYRKPTTPGVIIITNEAAVYMKAVSPESMHGTLLPPKVPLPGGFIGSAQWNSDVAFALGSLFRGPNWANAKLATAVNPAIPTIMPAKTKIIGHLYFLINEDDVIVMALPIPSFVEAIIKICRFIRIVLFFSLYCGIYSRNSKF